MATSQIACHGTQLQLTLGMTPQKAAAPQLDLDAAARALIRQFVDVNFMPILVLPER
jgi:hypothetical protein